VRPGQRYVPVDASADTPATLRVTRLVGQMAEVRNEHELSIVTYVLVERLLRTRPDGLAEYYRFLGYVPRAGYTTHAFLLEVDEDGAVVACPEWRPDVAVPVAATSIPRRLRVQGTWLRCHAVLSAEAPAHVTPTRFAPPEAGFDAQQYPVVTAVDPRARR
jgi:hypothetical protein